jgi:hypothetical protein
MGGGLLTLAAVGTVLGYLGPVSAIALPLLMSGVTGLMSTDYVPERK